MAMRLSLMGMLMLSLMGTVGCPPDKVNMQFLREEVINTYPPREQGLPLELAIVAVTPADIERSPMLDPKGQLIDSGRWFASYRGDNRCFGVPISQIHVFADEKYTFATWHGEALKGKGVANDVVGCNFKFPEFEKKWLKESPAYVLIFARYQGADQEIRPMRPIVIEERAALSGKQSVRVGKMEIVLGGSR